MGVLKEFKEFAVKGNVIDMAIGVIIGAAFGKIVSSLVEDIIMPPLGYLMSGVDFTKMGWTIAPAITDAAGEITRAAVVVRYGNFLQICLNFIIIAFVIFLLIRTINRMKKKAEDPGNKETPTPKDIQLLTDIRDLLKENQK